MYTDLFRILIFILGNNLSKYWNKLKFLLKTDFKIIQILFWGWKIREIVQRISNKILIVSYDNNEKRYSIKENK